MRVWDVEPSLLCRSHLLGEHAEVHGVFAVISGGLAAYGAHPEVRRWRGKLPALKKRHDALAVELDRRGYRHASPMAAGRGRAHQDVLIATVDEQLALLSAKGCLCRTGKSLVAAPRPKGRPSGDRRATRMPPRSRSVRRKGNT